MRSFLLALLMASVLLACRKSHDNGSNNNGSGTGSGNGNSPQTTGYDSTPTPFMQRTLVQLDPYHADSAWLQLPAHYKSGFDVEKYPLVIFYNGRYEGADYGNLRKLLKWAVPKFMADSIRFSFDVAGKKEQLIMLCPQTSNGYPSQSSINQTIDYMLAKYRVDPSRIYLTGLSSGAAAVFSYLTYSQQNAARIAAAVPMSSLELETQKIINMQYIAAANTPVQVFCGRKDDVFPENKSYAEEINKYKPGLAVFTPYGGAHGSWNERYDPSHAFYNPNMYEWMLQFHK